MGHVLSFTHCKEAPSTASSTPDSCHPDEVDSPAEQDDDLAVALADLWPLSSPQDPTFSYITIGSSSAPLPRPPARPHRGRGPIRARQTPRKEEPEEETVTYVLLEKGCHMTQTPPPLLKLEKRLQPQFSVPVSVMDLLYWRDISLSAGCLTGVTLFLLCLMQFSVISVVSYSCLIPLCGSLMIRGYAKLLMGLKKGDGSNPFQSYLEDESVISPQQVELGVSRLAALFLSALSTLHSLFLVKDAKESMKFLVLLYLLTYVGAALNGLTLLLLCVIGLFTFPVMYRHNQVLVDRYVSMVTSRVSAFRSKFRAQLRKQGAKKD